MDLLVVESPTKARTLKGYLGGDIEVVSTKGHIKDLPENRLAVDIEDGFKPTYVVLKGRKKEIELIKNISKRARRVLLGCDPDREGEAIAYHIKEEIEKTSHPEIKRVLFYEITKGAILKAIENPEEIDINKVYSQLARRILDRIVGYKVSPVLWKAISKGLSAGRVQTAGLRLLTEREREIDNFKPEKYYTITATLKAKDKLFDVKLKKGPQGEKIKITSEETAGEIVKKLKEKEFIVSNFRESFKSISPPPPLKTSTLQQEASIQFGFIPSRTMRIAQELYEGVELPSGRTGLITYMRTDSVRITDKAVGSIRKYVRKSFGDEYLPEKPNVFKDKESAQAAHEAIRPTNIERAPDPLVDSLSSDNLKVYSLIWKRAVSSQMEKARLKIRKLEVSAEGYIFEGLGRETMFDGFYKILGNLPKDIDLPQLEIGTEVELVDVKYDEHETEPPNRFTEATLIKALETNGIGRPSTYAPIITTLFERGYIERRGRYLKPTELGILVYDLLIPRFVEIFDLNFTAKMEEELDRVEEGKINWQELLKDFYQKFERELNNFIRELPKIKEEVTEKTEETCPVCGSYLIIRWGRYGKFLACSGFPKCKYTRPIELEIYEGAVCPVCGGEMVIRRSRGGRFLSCIDYPNCNGILPIKTGVGCPKCNGDIVERTNKKGKVFYACNRFPDCTFTLSHPPVEVSCKKCSFPVMMKRRWRKSSYLECPECKYRKRITQKDPL